MLRRSVLKLSSCRSVRGIPTRTTSQIPLYLSSRKEYSVLPQSASPGSDSAGKSSNPQSNFPKVLVGSVALGAAFLTAYQSGYLSGYLDKLFVRENHSDHRSPIPSNVSDKSDELRKDTHDVEDAEQVGRQVPVPPESNISIPNRKDANKNLETNPDVNSGEGKNDLQVTDLSEQKFQKDRIPIPDNALDRSPQLSLEDNVLDRSPQLSLEADSGSNNFSGELVDDTKNEEVASTKLHEETETVPTMTQAVSGEDEINSKPLQDSRTEEVIEDTGGKNRGSSSLLEAYCIGDKAEETSLASYDHKDVVEAVKKVDDAHISKDEKLVIDFLQAIHTAEEMQAELDAHFFAEEKRWMKEKYEKELKDARARELMYAEREAILNKELNKEKVKAAAALKSLQEQLEEELRMQIEKKDAETEVELKKLQDISKAQLTSAIASEKASQLEKMAEANLHINALCMAFYARSEEARQSHSVHKLALGTLAFVDALSNGLPIQREVDALHNHLEGIDKASLLDLVLSSLPEETLKYGTDTLLQLNQKFDGLKGTLRHFSLIPPGGGGILSHSLARATSVLKIKETDKSGDGIESLMNRVESLLAEGKLVEAADTLEVGLKGSQASEVAVDWVRRTRNRAITEQASTLLQSYATSVSLSYNIYNIS